jgi:four helix bundle protein
MRGMVDSPRQIALIFGIARGSVQECVPLLELAARRSLLSTEDHIALKSDLEEISRILSGLIKGLENREV